jgi:hypothetical protein
VVPETWVGTWIPSKVTRRDNCSIDLNYRHFQESENFWIPERLNIGMVRKCLHVRQNKIVKVHSVYLTGGFNRRNYKLNDYEYVELFSHNKNKH